MEFSLRKLGGGGGNSDCSDVGCCNVGIPLGFDANPRTFRNYSRCWRTNCCGYASLAEAGSYSFNISHVR
ncbi:unnamed protein product [Spirodela intermedia]|uniref:Uncharacterized protein n=1 Tax=Spirodela intermedia TaxID=51605 RepID=A0A7I8KCW8_SPIIN|nr:unnamed protein product [Spirodela intermedia]